MDSLKPIYLFADSQLLFWKTESQLFIKSILPHISASEPKAAYIGASNGDLAEYFEIFKSAMESIGIHDCRMILSDFGEQDQNYLEQADLILLAGGDVEQGWRHIDSSGIKDAVLKRYTEGSVLIGVSAGAVQLGMCALRQNQKLLTTFQIIPFIIGAHEEKQEWAQLKQTLEIKNGYEKGLGMPAGGGMIYHPDHTVEPIRHSITELYLQDRQMVANLLSPGGEKTRSAAVH